MKKILIPAIILIASCANKKDKTIVLHEFKNGRFAVVDSFAKEYSKVNSSDTVIVYNGNNSVKIKTGNGKNNKITMNGDTLDVIMEGQSQ